MSKERTDTVGLANGQDEAHLTHPDPFMTARVLAAINEARKQGYTHIRNCDCAVCGLPVFGKRIIGSVLLRCGCGESSRPTHILDDVGYKHTGFKRIENFMDPSGQKKALEDWIEVNGECPKCGGKLIVGGWTRKGNKDYVKVSCGKCSFTGLEPVTHQI